MKSIRTVIDLKFGEYQGDKKPKYKLKDYLQVYSGSYEGHRFYVKDIRYNFDIDEFEYLYDGTIMGGWYSEKLVVQG